MQKYLITTFIYLISFLLLNACVSLQKGNLNSNDIRIINSWLGLPDGSGKIKKTNSENFIMSDIQTIFHRGAFNINDAESDIIYTLPVIWKVFLNGKLISTPKATANSRGEALTTELDIQPKLFGAGKYTVEQYVGFDNKLVTKSSFEIK